MQDKKLYDITQVCELLHTTSRTLRFYEQKGIIGSTVIGISTRRHYTQEQLDLIRNVLVLRKLGLSLKTISELQRQGTDLKDALITKRAEIRAHITQKMNELALLNNALIMIEQEKDIFGQDLAPIPVKHDAQLNDIIKKCTDSIVFGHADNLYIHLSDTMKAYMPREAFDRIRADTLAPLGEFVAMGEIEHDSKHPNVAYQLVKYKKLGLKIKYVFYKKLIHGLWMGYYEI